MASIGPTAFAGTSTVASSVSSTLSSLASSATSAVASSIISSSQSPSGAAPSVSPTPTQAPGGGNGNVAAGSSPLLFFVALGFGVVFTNLWIIIGVKYCFRYNARNRQLRDENGDPIDLAAMPRQRRRREKKLMTLDEVNERFPITKYKSWVSSRADAGLPTAGGIDASASRPASVRAPSIREAAETSEPTTHPTESSSEPSAPKPIVPTTVEKSETPAETSTTTADAPSPATVTTSTHAEEEEDDPIQTAVPMEMLANPGDACAICIDTLEDDDDVRGLTCGHAFHASCVDPWLTTRRACCPLCKADYYVPKPRPENEQNAEEAARRGNPVTAPQPEQPPPTTPLSYLNPRRARTSRAVQNTSQPRSRWMNPFGQADPSTPRPAQTPRQVPRPRLFGWPRRQQTSTDVDLGDPSPSQLESGVVR